MLLAARKLKPDIYGFLSFPCGSAGKEYTCKSGDLDSIPGLGRFLGEGKSYPLQYSGLENSMDCIVQGVAESDKTERLSLSLYGFLDMKSCRHIIDHIPRTTDTFLKTYVFK